MADGFRAPPRTLSDAEKMHQEAVKAAAENLLNVLKGDSPDPRCMAIAITKLEECVLWAEKGIRIGAHL